MTIEQKVICDKDGEEMQEITAAEISAPVGSGMKTYSCPKCGALKMIHGPFASS